MIKIFRKMRQGLLTENKFSKYLLYAVGEIVLVVIGILIALNINNWNETKNNKFIEHNYLEEMLEDCENNLQKSKDVINIIQELLPIIIGLIEQSALEKPTISADSLNKAFSKINEMPSFSSTDRVYNNLIGSGDLKLIKNSQLKTKLSEYYKSLYILNVVQNTHELELVETFQPYIIDYLDFQAVNTIRINDFKLPSPVEKGKLLEIIGDRKFRNILTLKWTILTDLLNQNRKLEEINIKLVEVLKTLTKE